MSRAKAKSGGGQTPSPISKRGILDQGRELIPGLAEEAGFAYKNIDDVVEATALAGISLPVVKLVPLANVKG